MITTDHHVSTGSSERSQHGASGELVEAELEGLLGEERQQVDRGVDVTGIYLYVYIYIYMYTYIHVYIPIYIYIYV